MAEHHGVIRFSSNDVAATVILRPAELRLYSNDVEIGAWSTGEYELTPDPGGKSFSLVAESEALTFVPNNASRLAEELGRMTRTGSAIANTGERSHDRSLDDDLSRGESIGIESEEQGSIGEAPMDGPSWEKSNGEASHDDGSRGDEEAMRAGGPGTDPADRDHEMEGPPPKILTRLLFYLLLAGTIAMGAWALISLIG